MLDPRSAIGDVFRDRTRLRHLAPMLVDRGVEDTEVTVHSLGCTLWTLLGHDLGFAAVSELPTPERGTHAHTATRVRSDAVWFDRRTLAPVLIAEFERYEGRSDLEKIKGKVRNLLLAWHRWSPASATLVLAYWTAGLRNLPDHASLEAIIRDGFDSGPQTHVAGTRQPRVLFYQFLLRERPDRRVYLDEVLQRGDS